MQIRIANEDGVTDVTIVNPATGEEWPAATLNAGNSVVVTATTAHDPSEIHVTAVEGLDMPVAPGDDELAAPSGHVVNVSASVPVEAVPAEQPPAPEPEGGLAPPPVAGQQPDADAGPGETPEPETPADSTAGEQGAGEGAVPPQA